MAKEFRNKGRGNHLDTGFTPYSSQLSPEDAEELKRLGRLAAQQRIALQEAKKETKEAEKQAEEEARKAEVDALVSELTGTAGNEPTEPKEKGTALGDFAKGFTRGTANILDGIDPATWLLGQEQGFASKLGQQYGNDFIQDALKPAESTSQRVIDTIGQIGGSLNPFGAAYKGTKKATDLALSALSPDASDLARQATRGSETLSETAGTGAVAGGVFNQAGNVSAELQGDDRTLGEKLTHSALEIGLGGLGDVAVRGVGAGLGKLMNRGDAPTPPTAKEAPDEAEFSAEYVKDNVFPDAKVVADKSVIDKPVVNAKEVIDEVGKFSDGYARTAKEANPLKDKVKTSYNKFLTEMIDRNRLVRIAERQERGKGNEYVYKAKTLEEGAVPAAVHKLNDEFIPIFEELRKAKGVASSEFDAVKEFLEYPLALQMRDEALKGARLPKGMTQESIEETISKFEGSNVVKNATKQLRQFVDSHMDMLVDSGYWSAEDVVIMKANNENYFPLFRNVDDLAEFEKAITPSPRSGRVHSREAEGSELQLGDPVDNLINYSMNMHRLAAKARTNGQLHELALSNPNSKMVRIVDRPNKFGNTITSKIAGKTVHMEVDPDVYKALDQSTTEGEKSGVMKMVEGIAKLQRVSVVGTPDFMLKEMVRNPAFSWITSRAGSSLSDYGRAAIHMLTPSQKYMDDYNKFIGNGGGLTSILGADVNMQNSVKNLVEKGKPPKGVTSINNPTDLLDKWRMLNEMLDQIPKFGEYLATQRKGNDIREGFLGLKGKIKYEPSKQQRDIDAAFNAREVYDHQMAGTFTKKANKITSFMNSNIRGKDKFIQAMRENPVRTMVRSGIVATPPLLMAHLGYKNWASDDQRRRIDETPLEVKEMYYHIPSPFDDNVWRIAKPFEAHLALGKGIEEILRINRGTTYERELEEHLMAFVKSNVIYEPSLNPLKPVTELAFNENSFTGQPIVDPYDDRDLGEQIEVTTSNVAILMAGMLNGITSEDIVSPKQVDHLISGYFPSASDYALNTIDLATKDNLPNERALIVNPFQRAFVQNNTGYSPTQGDLYETSRELDKERRNTEEGENFMYENVRSEVVKPAEKELKELRDLRKTILDDPQYNPQQKQKALDTLNAEINAITRKLRDAGVTGTDDRTNISLLEQSLLN